MGELHINLLGTSFTIKATEDSAYLEKLLGYYENITKDVARIDSVRTPLQISILSGIMLCDELYKSKSSIADLKNNKPVTQNTIKTEQNNQPANDSEIQKRAQELIDRINKVL